ncbi:histone deacetylase complex subunit SAP130-like [Rhopilema esculentum]|uniref:histone deacetylase complex subunit SAP130-like n=1 Tax=Rhopilema esculentum TaxID=499914 RepID=UPI0031DD7E04
MNRSHDERQSLRGEGVMNSVSNRSMNPVMSVASLEKDKHESSIGPKMNSGNEHSGYRAVDLIKPSKSLSNAMSHVSVGSAPLPPMPPLQAPLLTSILPGPGHPIMPPGLPHGTLVHGSALPAQIPLMGRAAAAVAPPRASIAVPPLRATTMPPLKSASNASQISQNIKIPVPGKGTSIFSPVVPSNRLQPSSSAQSSGQIISRSIEHTKGLDSKTSHVQADVHQMHSNSSSGNAVAAGTATVQVIASGTAPLGSAQSSKSFSVIPNQNILKIGSQSLQYNQTSATSNSIAAVTTYRVAPPPNNIAFSKIIPQPILIPSTTSGTPSTTKPDSQDHPKSNTLSSSSHGRLSPTTTSSHHSAFTAHHHYNSGIPGSSNQPHMPYSSNENKNDKLKPGNPSLQYAIGSYFPIDTGFSHPIGVHRFPSGTPFHSYVRTPSGSTSSYGSFPMFVEGTRGFASAPLPIPGMTPSARDSHHHSTSGESSPVMNSSYSIHNFPNLQSSSYHTSGQQSNVSSSRPGPGILRKRTAEGYPVHGLDRISSPTKQEPRIDHRQEHWSDSRPSSGSGNAPSRQESPRLLCDEKTIFSDSFTSVAESSSYINSSISSITTNAEMKVEPVTPPVSAQNSSVSVSGALMPAVSTASVPEASPRKKPRKQNVVTTEDKFSKVSLEEEDVELESKFRDKRKETKVDSPLIRIQKPAPKLKTEEPAQEVKQEPVEPDENTNYYMFISRRRSSALGDYKINSKAAYHHFYRYSDVKSKEEKKPIELLNNKRILQNISAWRIHHISSQMDDLCSLENEVCNKLFEFQRELPRPSKQFMLTALCHDLQNGKRHASVDEQLRVLHELIQGNIQRCQLSMEQLVEAKQTMLRVTDHKPKILDIIKKHKHKRSTKKKTLPSY